MDILAEISLNRDIDLVTCIYIRDKHSNCIHRLVNYIQMYPIMVLHIPFSNLPHRYAEGLSRHVNYSRTAATTNATRPNAPVPILLAAPVKAKAVEGVALPVLWLGLVLFVELAGVVPLLAGNRTALPGAPPLDAPLPGGPLPGVSLSTDDVGLAV